MVLAECLKVRHQSDEAQFLQAVESRWILVVGRFRDIPQLIQSHLEVRPRRHASRKIVQGEGFINIGHGTLILANRHAEMLWAAGSEWITPYSYNDRTPHFAWPLGRSLPSNAVHVSWSIPALHVADLSTRTLAPAAGPGPRVPAIDPPSIAPGVPRVGGGSIAGARGPGEET